jgi:hypothetical protein
MKSGSFASTSAATSLEQTSVSQPFSIYGGGGGHIKHTYLQFSNLQTKFNAVDVHRCNLCPVHDRLHAVGHTLHGDGVSSSGEWVCPVMEDRPFSNLAAQLGCWVVCVFRWGPWTKPELGIIASLNMGG